MTTRQTGRRAAPVKRRSAAGKRVRRAGKRDVLRPKERRQLLQLVVCGSIFVVLVAVKLLLPDTLSAFRESLSGALERNIDVQAVFSAVGRAFSGEEEGAQDIYQAVFGAEKEETAVLTAATLTQPLTAMDALRQYRPEVSDARPQELPPFVLYSEENLPEGVSMEQAILDFDYCAPVSGAVSSEFGYREHPAAGEERFHYGIDLAADTGTDVLCFADGTVTAVGESSSYGKYCIVSHSGGYSTLYAHCSRIKVSADAAVKKGEAIAEVGQTGMATGPHLHFELQQNGVYLNPVYYL